MGAFDKAKILAEIAEISSRVYGALKDRTRKQIEQEARIKELEKRLAELEKK